MTITNPERFAQKKHIASSVERLFELIKKWGATPFDGVETALNPQPEPAPEKTGVVDTIIYDDNQNRFYLKRVEGMLTIYYQAWEESSMSMYIGKDGSTLTDRLFVSPETYIIKGQLLNFKTIQADIDTLFEEIDNLTPRVASVEGTVNSHSSSITSLQTTVGQHETRLQGLSNEFASKDDFNTDHRSLMTTVQQLAEKGATYFGDIVKGTINVTPGSPLESGDIVYNPESATFFYRVEHDGVPTYYSEWSTKNSFVATATGKARTDRFFVSSHGYIINGEMFEADTTEVKGLITALQRTVDGHTTNIDYIKTSLSKDAVTRFDEVIKNKVSITPSPALDREDGDEVVFYAYNNTFILKRTSESSGSVRYFTNWYDSEIYNATTPIEGGGTYITADPAKFFVSPQGYVINGTLFEADLSSVEASITAIQKVLNGDDTQTDAILKAGVVAYLRTLQSVVSVHSSEISTLQTDATKTNGRVLLLETQIKSKADSQRVDTLQDNLKAAVTDFQNSIAILAARFADYVTQTDYNAQQEVWANALNDLNNRIAGVMERVIVDELPAEGEENKIYMLEQEDEERETYYDQYIWMKNKNEQGEEVYMYVFIGSSKVNMDGYVREADYNRLVASNVDLRISTAVGEPASILKSTRINIKEGDKITVKPISQTMSQAYSLYDCSGTEPVLIANQIAFGAEYTFNNAYSKIDIVPQIIGKPGTLIVALRILNSELAPEVMTDDDIAEIFNNL